MIDPLDIPDPVPELPPDLRARRAASLRRRRRRRRLVALAGIVAVGGGVGVAVALALGGGSGATQAAKSSPQAAIGQTGPSYPASWEPHTGPVPILEYHAIQPPIPGSPYPQLFVPQADFQQQMSWLQHQGYEGVTLDQVEKAWYHGGELPPKPIVISFDDGYASQFVAAFPFLKQLGWPGVLNLKATGSDLSDDQVKQMIAAGWELASHTIHHLDLTTLDPQQLHLETAGARRVLQQRFGVPVHNFCYPSGRFNATVIAAVKQAGYTGATTEIPGLADRDHPYTLDRLEIEYSDGLSGFIRKLQEAQAGATAGITTTPG